MSEYANIYVGNLLLYSFRNYLKDEIVSLFYSDKDLFVTPECTIDDEDEESGVYTRYVYKTTVKRAKERFDALGFGLNNFKKVFDEKKIQAINYSSFLSRLRIDYDENDEKIEKRIKEKVTFKKWTNSMTKIISYETMNGNIWSEKMVPNLIVSTECDKVIYYSLLDKDSESFYALNTEIINIAFVYRLILENCSDNEEIVLDFSYLDNWAEDSITKALEATKNIQKTIVLVEGTSDKDILDFSLKHLYPHLYDIFYFMDFDDKMGVKRDGGTSYINKNIKTFYFSKLKANFIAVFDNDAEGYISQSKLISEIKNWPNNFKILRYPELNFLKSYPTIAPNGSIVQDDINCRAASIELYLPDFIIKPNGDYYPVEWEARKRMKLRNGEEKSLYQGTISHKDDIKNEFHSIRKKIEKGEIEFLTCEWKNMKKVLDSIVFAFNKD